MSYEKNVFINCPFDQSYRQLKEKLIFVLEFYGFNTQMSVNKSSTHDRLIEISEMIKNSKYTIHDLSRHKAAKKGEYARFNMPFELGIDFGCYLYLKNKRNKVIAVLDSDPHAYDIYLSDMSGRDILYHKDNPDLLFEIIPTWLSKSTGIIYDSPKRLKAYYTLWYDDYKRILKSKEYDLRTKNNLDVHYYKLILKKWIEAWKTSNQKSS